MIKIPDKFTTRAFYVKHLAPYEYVKCYASNAIVLDAGTSHGYGANYLAQTARQVVGIDLNEDSIKKASRDYNKKNLQFTVCDVLNIEFPEEYFDIIISSQVIEHIPLDQLGRYLSELNRILKKGGVCFISTLNLTHNLKGRAPKEYDKSPHHVKEFTASELSDSLKTQFAKVEILGLRRSPRHKFYSILKKSGAFRTLPRSINPVTRFFDDKISLKDFVYSDSNLDSCFDLLGICRKQ